MHKASPGVPRARISKGQTVSPVRNPTDCSGPNALHKTASPDEVRPLQHGPRADTDPPTGSVCLSVHGRADLITAPSAARQRWDAPGTRRQMDTWHVRLPPPPETDATDGRTDGPVTDGRTDGQTLDRAQHTGTAAHEIAQRSDKTVARTVLWGNTGNETGVTDSGQCWTVGLVGREQTHVRFTNHRVRAASK